MRGGFVYRWPTAVAKTCGDQTMIATPAEYEKAQEELRDLANAWRNSSGPIRPSPRG
jgi:hypothetical protein